MTVSAKGDYDLNKMAKKQKVIKKISILGNTFNFINKSWTPLLTISLTGAVIWKLWRIFAVPFIAQLLGINLSVPYLPENIPLIPLTILLLLTLIFAFKLVGLIQTTFILLLNKPDLKGRAFFQKFAKEIIPVTVVMLLILLLLITGTLLLVVPLFIFAFFVQFAVYLTILENKNGVGALIKSAKLVKANFSFILLRTSFLWAIVITVHLLTRKLLFTSIAYHTIVNPFIITYYYYLYKTLKK